MTTPCSPGLELDTSYDITQDPSLQLSNQRVQEARDAVAAGSDRVYRIYTDGIFDLFHIGHMQMLKQAKHALGNPKNVHLVAGVCTDADTRKYKGKNVMNEQIRFESLKHCKWVDEVIEGVWVPDLEFLEKNKIDFIAHDAIPYVSAGTADCYQFAKEAGKFLATQRTAGLSTTDLIVQIVRDYDEHIVRNLKRGVDKKSLNIGRTWAIRAVAHQKEQKLKSTLDDLKSEQQQVLKSIKSLTMCLNKDAKFGPNSSPKATKQTQTIAQEEDTSNNVPTSICDEVGNVAKHSYSLCGALTNCGFAVLGYFNVFSYINMYQQTNQNKND